MKKEFREVDRKSKVKMYKSGKNWITVILTQMSLLRIMGGKVSEIILSNRESQKNDNEFTKKILTGLVTVGTISATANNQIVVNADELVVEKGSIDIENNLVTKDSVLLSVESQSNEKSTVNSESLLDSISLSEFDSKSLSQSMSYSDSQSTSQSIVASKSSYASESISNSQSHV